MVAEWMLYCVFDSFNMQVASVIIHEELSTSDPGFGLAYLGIILFQ